MGLTREFYHPRRGFRRLPCCVAPANHRALCNAVGPRIRHWCGCETLRKPCFDRPSGLMIILSCSKPTAYFAIRSRWRDARLRMTFPRSTEALRSILEARAVTGEAFCAAVRPLQRTFRQLARIIAHSLAKVTQDLRAVAKSRHRNRVQSLSLELRQATPAAPRRATNPEDRR